MLYNNSGPKFWGDADESAVLLNKLRKSFFDRGKNSNKFERIRVYKWNYFENNIPVFGRKNPGPFEPPGSKLPLSPDDS